MMRKILNAPSVTVIDVWENMVTIRIEQHQLEHTPDKWDISVFSEKRMIQSFQLTSPSLIEDVRIDHGLEYAEEVTVTVRGVSSQGSSRDASVTQKLLPTPSLEQREILPKELSLHWFFADWMAPVDRLVGKYEIAIAADEGGEVETVQEFICSFGDDTNCLQGNALIKLAPHLVRHSNFRIFGRVRCYSAKNQVWGQWSPKVKLMCLSSLGVDIRNTTSTSLTVLWGRERPEVSMQNIFDTDVAVDRFEVISWPAKLVSAYEPSNAATLPTRSVSTGQAHTFGLNMTTLDGLEPHTVYNVCCRWLQCCGGGWHRKYFRVETHPEPEIVSVPKIGHSYVELNWAPKGFVLGEPATDLTKYGDDNIEVGADHSPSFQLVYSSQNRSTDLHRISVTTGIIPITSFDVQHQQEYRVQRCIVEGLPSGTALRFSVKTASHFCAQDIDHWEWGRTSDVKVATTVSDVRVIPQERGPNFIVFHLQCDPLEPVRKLESLFCIDDPKMMPSFATPHSGVYSIEPLCEGEANITSFPGDGDKSWGVRRASMAKGAFTAIRLDSLAKVQLTQLKANWTYRFSLNVRDMEGKWWGRKSIAFTTSAEDLIYVRPYVQDGPERHLCVDQAYHDRLFSMASNVSIRYPVTIGEQRRDELSSTVAQLPSRLSSIALRGAVTALGSDHCILEWQAMSLADGKDGVTYVIKETDAAAVNLFNTAKYALHEYRLKIFVNELQSHQLASQRATGTTSTVKDIYFRSAVRTAKILGFEEGYRYQLSLSYFNVISQKWSPWSETINVRPVDRLVGSAVRITGTGVTFRWKKQLVPPIDRQATHSIAPIRYDVTIQSTGRDPHVVQVKQPEYELKDLATGVISVAARPWFDEESCGPYSKPCYISVSPLKILAEGITQSTATLTWQLPNVCPVEGAKGRIVLTVSATGNATTTTTTTIDIGPFEDRFQLKNLLSSSEYVVSGLQLVEVTSSSPPHVHTAADPSKFMTLGALSVRVAEVGEDFAVIEWPRSPVQIEPSMEQAANTASLSSPIRLRGSLPISKMRLAMCHERYELVVEDVIFGHMERYIVPYSKAALTHIQHKVIGLLPSGSYRVKVRIDSEAAFFSEEVSFRTPGPLQLRFARTGSREGTVVCLHPLSNDEGEIVTWVAVRTATELSVRELPKAPPRKLTGTRAALALLEGQRLYHSKHALPSHSNTLTLTNLPPVGTSLLLSARQRSSASNGDWLPWVQSEVILGNDM